MSPCSGEIRWQYYPGFPPAANIKTGPSGLDVAPWTGEYPLSWSYHIRRMYIQLTTRKFETIRSHTILFSSFTLEKPCQFQLSITFEITKQFDLVCIM